MTTERQKSNIQQLKDVLGAEAYLEYKMDLSSKADLKNQEAIVQAQKDIVQTQTKLVIEKVEDKFERRLVEETSKLNEKMTNGFAMLHQEMNTQLKWIVGTILGFGFTMASLFMGLVYFLHQ